MIQEVSIKLSLKVSIEKEGKNCQFIQFFVNHNPDLFQSVLAS